MEKEENEIYNNKINRLLHEKPTEWWTLQKHFAKNLEVNNKK